MSDNVQKDSGLASAKIVSPPAVEKGFRDSPAYNYTLGAIILALAIGIAVILVNQNSQPDGAELLSLTERRVQKQAQAYLAKKKIRADGIEVPKDLAFKVGTLEFTTPDVRGSKTLPDVIEFEMNLITTGAPEGKQGKIVGFFTKSTGAMLINYDLIYAQDSVPSGYSGWDVE
jgi:hypothetical protein